MIILRMLGLFYLFMSIAIAAININTASESELTGLPGIGPSKAAAIIAYRDANGPFSSVDSLSNVKGIGAKTVDGLRSSATTGDGDDIPPAAAASPTPSTGAGNIDINTATSGQLQKFNGVGPATAQKIVDYRTANGAFSSCEDLIKVNGIGNATLQKIKPDCKVVPLEQ